MDRREELITDIPSRVVAGPVGEAGKRGQWRFHAYRAREYSGKMVTCGFETNPDPLVIRLDVRGPYRIHLGLFKVFQGSRTVVRLRLSSDSCCRMVEVTPREHASDTAIYEIPWRDANLTNQELILEAEYNVPGSLASIRLEPIPALTEPKSPDVAFPMAVTEDGHQAFVERPHRRPEDLYEALDRIPDNSCMRILLWCIAGADLCNYPTRVGTYDYGRSRDPILPGYGVRDENMRLWRKNGWDSMQVMGDYARKRGWEFHVSMRMEAFSAHYPFDDVFFSEFFNAHPELRCRDEKGEIIGRLSYAHPEVQDHILAIAGEILAYEPDGFNAIFVRGMPLVLYEPIMVEGFQREYGLNALDLAEDDERWTAYKCNIITGFMRRLKSLLKPGQRLSALMPPDKYRCYWGGLDVETWVGEGIIDDVYPVAHTYDEHDVHRFDDSALDLDYFLNLLGRERIRVIPVFSRWTKPGARQLIGAHLDNGADGYCLWDGASKRVLPDSLDLGYRERPPRVERGEEYRRVPLQRIGDFRIDRYHPWEVF